MSKIEQLMREITKDSLPEQEHPRSEEASQKTLSNILRVIGPLDKLSLDTLQTRISPPQNWSDLIEKVRAAAARVRELEADAQEQELRVGELLERVREDMKTANERAYAAEAHARDIQTRMDALLKAAEDRIKSAETRAQIAEEWLGQVSQTIVEEFKEPDAERLTA